MAYNPAEAGKFLAVAAIVNYDYNKILEYMFDLDSANPALLKVRLKLGSYGGGKGIHFKDDFYYLKDLVRADKMCKVVEAILKHFKGTDNYNKTISYLIESPDVDRNRKYDCGDAELEMLLKD